MGGLEGFAGFHAVCYKALRGLHEVLVIRALAGSSEC